MKIKLNPCNCKITFAQMKEIINVNGTKAEEHPISSHPMAFNPIIIQRRTRETRYESAAYNATE